MQKSRIGQASVTATLGADGDLCRVVGCAAREDRRRDVSLERRASIGIFDGDGAVGELRDATPAGEILRSIPRKAFTFAALAPDG